MKPFEPKARPCPMCSKLFAPARMGQKVCSPKCAIKHVKQEKAQERAKIKTRKEAGKNLNDLHREAQAAVNEWIRWRDRGQPCISCGKPLPLEAVGGGFDAGHYLSRGAAPHLRYDVANIHGQCKQCNRYGAGMAPAYRVGLISRIGLAAVECLEANRAKVHKWQHDEVREIRDRYRAINRTNRRGL